MTTPQSASGSPRQPWVHDLVICVHGPATALSDRDGTMGLPGTGLFVDDRRVLSRLAVAMGGEIPAPVVSAAAGSTASFLSCARNLGDVGPDPTIELRQSRTVHPDGFTENLEITSRAAGAVNSTLVVTLAGDGAEIASVKSGEAALRPPAPLPAGLIDDGVSWSDDRHRTRVTCSPAPTRSSVTPSGEAVLEFAVEVPSYGRTAVSLTLVSERVVSTTFDAGAGSGLVTWGGVGVRSADARFSRAVSVSLQDIEGLLLTDPQQPSDPFCAAGTPWYLTLFGRDSLWAARLMLPFGTQLAAGTLRTLARRQGKVKDTATAGEPGKILHEVRRTSFDDVSAGLKLPPQYYGTVDATALWLCVLVDAWRYGMPENEVRELLPNARAAFDWLRSASSIREDGLLRYQDESGHGLANQGWKDSGDSMRRADGTIAPAPIALIEAQGYAVEATRQGATMLDALGEKGSAEWRGFADNMEQRIRDTYWTGADPYLAMAVDGAGNLVDGIGSNMGHLLGTGALTDEEVSRVVNTLTSPDMLGEFGISTLSRSNPAFNPIGYHTGSVWTHDTAICALGMSREGRTEQAAVVVQALINAAASFGGRWPELFAGDGILGAPAPYPAACRPQGWSAASCGAVVSAVLGLVVDVPGGSVTLNPPPQLPFGAVTVRGLAFGDSRFDVEVASDGSASVHGLPDTVTVHHPSR